MAQTPAVRKQNQGETIDYTPVAAVVAGTVVEVGGYAYIAQVDIAAGALGALATTGVFDVPKATGSISDGANVYWDNNGSPNVGDASSGAATGTSSGNTLLGQAVGTAASGDTYVRVRLSAAGASSTATLLLNVEAVAAAGSVQGDAGAVGASTSFVHGTGADATKGIVLPAAAAGKMIIVKNADAANAVLKVYPASGDAINALSANAAISMAAKTSAVFIALDATTWYTVPLLPS